MRASECTSPCSRHRLRCALQLAAILGLLAAIWLGGCGSAAEAEEWATAFDSGDGWVVGADAVADVKVADGVMQIHVHQPGQLAWAASEGQWQDFILQVDATQVAGPHDNEYGVLVRMDGDRRFYAFSISGDGYVRVARYDSGRWIVLGPDWTPHEAVRQGEATNSLEVRAEGAVFSFQVNGQSVAEVEDATLRAGSVGLYAGAFGEPDVVVEFDDLHVSLLD